jgi:hypothetical protein
MAAKTHVIEFAGNRTQARFDVAKTFSKGQLRKCQTQKLIQARKIAPFVIAAITLDALVELVRWDVIDQLREDRPTRRHAPLSVGQCEVRHQRQKPSPRVGIEKNQNRIHAIEDTGVRRRLWSDSRTAVNQYIADCGNKRIRLVGASGIISTIAGNGKPLFAGDGGPATSAVLNAPNCGAERPK